MESLPAEIAYAASTDAATFMLDADGICRWTVARPGARGGAEALLAERCVGAQYVATLDVSTAGGLVELPRVGCPLLFARLDERGRISLLRTGPVTRFEARGAARDKERTFAAREEEDDSGVHATPRAQPAAAPPVPELDPYADESATMRFSPAQILKAMHAVPPDDTLEPPSTVPVKVKVPLAALPPKRGVLPRRRAKAAPLPPPPRVHAARETAAPSGILPKSEGEAPSSGRASDPLIGLRAGRGRRG